MNSFATNLNDIMTKLNVGKRETACLLSIKVSTLVSWLNSSELPNEATQEYVIKELNDLYDRRIAYTTLPEDEIENEE